MGSYTDLTIDGYSILETKSYVIPEVMTLFQESDKRIGTRKASGRWRELKSDSEDQDGVVVTYSSEVAKVVDRLNVMGFTMRRVRDDFESFRESEIEKYTAWLEEGDDDGYRAELNYFTHLTFDRYAEALRTVLTQRIRPHSAGQSAPYLDPVAQKIVGDNEDHIFGFLGSDLRAFIRLACELVPQNSEVVQDISELVEAGYYEEDEPVCTNSTRALTGGHPENSARIILTEGPTDVEILKAALSLLYPHLCGYYTFLDFASSRPQGGVGSLVTTVKAFAAAGITNRIIAVFDNDTAAFDARRSLASIQLPKNIAVCNYPDLSSLESYPTLGPTGLARLNINGLAASIEVYLGSDLLSNGEGFPVQWKGYVESLRKYQGEVMYKSQLQEKFREKVARCSASTDEFSRCDWSGLRAIFDVIFHAFD